MIGKLLALRHNLAINCVMLALMGIGIGLVSLLLGATDFGVTLFRAYFDSNMVILLNLLPPVLLVFIVYFISGRAWIAFTFPALLIFILSIVQFYKVQIHGEAFIFSDILVAREAAAVVFDITLKISWRITFTIVTFVCGVLFSIFALKHKLRRIPPRMIAAAVTIAVSIGLYALVYTDTDLYRDTSVRVAGASYSAMRRHIARGFVYPFIHSIHTMSVDRQDLPHWYNEQEARQLTESYHSTDIPDDRRVNLICLMLESYADFTLFDVLDFEVDVYGPFHELQEESITGELVTNIFAGWTIDTERLFLTGNTRLMRITSPTNSYIHYLNKQGYHTEGLHAGDGWFYDRLAINRHLGFNDYYYLEDFEESSRNDSFFFPTVRDMYLSRDKSKPYFSYNLSFQNHSGFESAWMLEQPAVAQGELSDESFKILTNYLAGIYDTTWRLENFIDSLRADPEPVVVLVFGDHLPWLGESGSIYAELGINVDRDTEDGFFNRFTTPYIVWANDAAKGMLDNDFVGDGGSFSPGFLMGALFEICGWEGDGYMQAMRDLQEHIDVVAPALGLFRANGVLTDTLSEEAEAAYRRHRAMEILRRENYSQE